MSSEDYVVLDCDTGSDDAWALLLLLKADKVKKVNLLGVTCVNGNTSVDNAVENTLRILELSDRSDIPVFKGSNSPLIPIQKPADLPDFHGEDGFGCLSSKQTTKLIPETKNAVQALYDFASLHPQKVTFILVGPLTNFALALKVYPDFSSKIKEVFIMGGNIQGIGNTTRTAEFNFFTDPEAAHIVLNETSFKINILPWEACLVRNFSIPLKWRLDILGSNENKAVQLLNDVENVQYTRNNYSEWLPCDALATAAFLFPDQFVIKTSSWHATVELHGSYTRGQMILDHLKKGRNNVRIIEEGDCKIFKKIAKWALNDNENI